MRVKVINKDNCDFDKEFKVRRMNYDQTVVNYSNSKGINVFLNRDLEFIPESAIDNFLISHKYFLKIKLNRGISIILYKFLLDIIQQQFNEELYDLNLLKEKYISNKRGIWEKDIVCIINKRIPVNINANGENFKKTGYNINIEEIKTEDFLDLCTIEIRKIEKEINKKNSELTRYGIALKQAESREKSYKLLGKIKS